MASVEELAGKSGLGTARSDVTSATPAAFLGKIGRNLHALSAFAVRISAAALAYLLQIVLARSLGAGDYGMFSFAWSVITIGGFLATLGFGQTAVRFLAQYHQSGANEDAHGFIRLSLLMTLAGSLGFTLLIYAFFPLVEIGFGALCCTVLMVGLVALPFFAVTDLVEGFARSQGWTLRALIPPYLLRQSGIILFLLGWILSGGTVSASGAMVAAVAATTLACLVQGALTIRPLLALFPKATPRYEARGDWITASRPTLLSDLTLLARQNIDLILLGLLAPAESVGLYFAATRIASLLGLIDFAVGAAFGHRFARAMAEGGPACLAPVFRDARRLTALPGLLVAAGLMVGAPTILSVFGAEFAAAAPATFILLCAAAFRLLIGPAEDALAMSGYASDVWRANAVGALVMAIGCLLLCRDWQIAGAAAGALAGSAASSLVLIGSMRQRLSINPIGFPRKAIS